MKLAHFLVVLVLLIAHVESRSSMKLARKHHEFKKKAESSTTQASSKTHTWSDYRHFSAPKFGIDIYGGLLTYGAYYLPITIGTPAAATYNVLFDTGSSNLAVPGPNCGTCGSGNTVYYPSNSSTSSSVLCSSNACRQCTLSGTKNCLFGQPYCSSSLPTLCGNGISYGGGSSYLTGPLYNDVVTLPDVSVKAASIIAMDSQVPSNSLTGSPFDGIIGFAYDTNACNPTCVPSLFSTIVAQTKMENLFGLCLNASSGGVVDLGYIDPTKFYGNLQWVPVVQERWYNMALLDVMVGGVSIGMPPVVYQYLNDQIGSFIDSGTSIILFGPAIYAAFQSLWQANYCKLPGVCGNNAPTIFSGACLTDAQMGNSLMSFPNVNFIFNGQGSEQVSLQVGPLAYFMHSNGQYCFGFSSVPGISAVMGDVFMENFYIVHDRANTRVGFAPITNCY